MDDRSLMALLAKAERSRRPPQPARVWLAAALVLTVVGGYIGTLLLRTEALGPVPRILAFVTSSVFGALALYCWYRLLRS